MITGLYQAEKKLVDYLAPGQKVLIRFGHGLGDTLMFIPLLEALKYPGVSQLPDTPTC